VQSSILTEVRDCDLLNVVTSSTFLKRKDMLKEKSRSCSFLQVVFKVLFVDLEVVFKLHIFSFGHIGQFLYMDSADGMSAWAKLHIFPLATSVSSYPWTRIMACRQRRG